MASFTPPSSSREVDEYDDSERSDFYEGDGDAAPYQGYGASNPTSETESDHDTEEEDDDDEEEEDDDYDDDGGQSADVEDSDSSSDSSSSAGRKNAAADGTGTAGADSAGPDLSALLRADSRHMAHAFLCQVKEDAAVLNDEAKELAEVVVQCVTSMYGLEENEDASLRQNLTMPFSFQGLFHAKLRRVKTASRISERKREESLGMKDQGNTFVSNGLFEDAVVQYHQAEALDPANPAIYCNRAAAYTKLWRPWEAVSDCAIAINLDPGYTKAIGRLGCAYARLGHVDLSMVCYEKASEQDPNSSIYAANLEVLRKYKQDEDNGEQSQLNIVEFIATLAGLKDVLSREAIPLMNDTGSATGLADSSGVIQALISSLYDAHSRNT